MHALDEVADDLRAVLLVGEHGDLRAEVNREADVVELDLVGAGVDALPGERDGVVLRLGVVRVEPVDVNRLSGRRELDREARILGMLVRPRIVKARDAEDDADPAPVREPDGAREVGNVEVSRGAGLDDEGDLRRVVDVPLVVLLIEDHGVEASLGELVERVDPSDARVGARHEDTAEGLVLGPPEALLLGVFAQHTCDDARDFEVVPDDRALRVLLRDRVRELVRGVELADREVSRGDRRDGLSGGDRVHHLDAGVVRGDRAARRHVGAQELRELAGRGRDAHVVLPRSARIAPACGPFFGRAAVGGVATRARRGRRRGRARRGRRVERGVVAAGRRARARGTGSEDEKKGRGCEGGAHR